MLAVNWDEMLMLCNKYLSPLTYGRNQQTHTVCFIISLVWKQKDRLLGSICCSMDSLAFVSLTDEGLGVERSGGWAGLVRLNQHWCQPAECHTEVSWHSQAYFLLRVATCLLSFLLSFLSFFFFWIFPNVHIHVHWYANDSLGVRLWMSVREGARERGRRGETLRSGEEE